MFFLSRWFATPLVCFFFFFNDTATTEIYTLSLHDALPISVAVQRVHGQGLPADHQAALGTVVDDPDAPQQGRARLEDRARSFHPAAARRRVLSGSRLPSGIAVAALRCARDESLRGLRRATIRFPREVPRAAGGREALSRHPPPRRRWSKALSGVACAARRRGGSSRRSASRSR